MDEQYDEIQPAASPLTFDLHIVFVGLCMLVDDDQRPTEPKRLHVLLPRTGVGSGSGKHAHTLHLARLYFRAGHQTGMPEPEGAPPVHCELRNRQLDLTGLRLATPDPLNAIFARSNVFDLGTFADREVERRLVDHEDGMSPDDTAAFRLTLDAGTIHLRKKGAIWRIGDREPENMAVAVRWKIGSVVASEDGAPLTLDLTPLNLDGSPERIDLFPIDGKVELWLYHSPEDQLPRKVPPDPKTPRPPTSGVADHFTVFYDLLTPPDPGEVPRFVDAKPDCTTETDPEPGDAEVIGDTAPEVPGNAAKSAPAPAKGEKATIVSGDEVACIVVTAKAAAS